MSKLLVQVSGLVLLLAGTSVAQVTQRVSVGSSGTQGNSLSSFPSISADGRFVVFESAASNLVAGDTNGSYDVFVRDRQNGTTERVSVDSSGTQANFSSVDPSISADGRYATFRSYATNLVPLDTNAVDDVFVHDRQSGSTERVSVSTSEVQGNFESRGSAVSADGRFVAFSSLATNFVPGVTLGIVHVYVRDRQNGTTECISVDPGGDPGDSYSDDPSISADGRYVAFWGLAGNLVPGDTGFFYDVFVRDRQTGTTELVSVDSSGVQGNNDCVSSVSARSISPDGRYVAFHGIATNLVPGGDTNGTWDVFVRDRQSGTTERVSVDSSRTQANASSFEPSISADGRYVAFVSLATNLAPADTNGTYDVFIRDRELATTERVSVDSGDLGGNQASVEASTSADGRYVAFRSDATNLVPGDTNGVTDVFVRDRLGAPSFTSLCDPGVGGVIACPCGNPPSGLGRGCNNSSSTGGAILSAAGGTYLSSDSLVFTTSGEKPTALSIVAQWSGVNASGVVFGMGVRCTSGALKRLYTKAAVAGSITAPNFGAGDPQVSARSAALGDSIAAGASRWYLVYYRDATVLGGCPGTSTFNATQTGQIAWQP